MKRIAFAITILLAVAILAVPASAQSRTLAKAEIPFNFSANDQELTAGTYRLYQISSQLIRLHNIATNRGVTLLTPQNIAESVTTRHVFRVYGTRLFLGSVIADSYQISLRPSQNELDLRKMNIAMNTMTLQISR